MALIDNAIELFKENKIDEARRVLEICFDVNNDDYLANRYLGLCHIELKNYDNALIFLKHALELSKNHESEGDLGVCYWHLKDYERAQIHLITSVMDKYEDKYAKVLEKALLSKHNDEAMLGLKLLMHDNHPKDIFILRDLTSYAQKLKKYDLAIQYFDVLLKLCPDDYVAWNNLGLIYEELNNWKKSYECYKKSLSFKDFFSPNFNLGIMSRKMHRFEDSIKYLKKAIIQNPNSPQPKYSLAMSYMMLKDFKNGYPLYANHMTIIMPAFYRNEWRDTDFHTDKTLCIFTTGGLGDMIMFSRYFDYIKGYFKKIYILLPETLHSIFKYNFPYLEIIDSKVIFTDFDYAVTPMHIPNIFNLDFTVFVPKPEGFFEVKESLVKKFERKLKKSDKLKVAINWHGNREGTRTFFNRSMPLSYLEPVFEKYKEKIDFYSAQKDDSHTDCEKYPEIVDLYDEIKNFEDTAAILKNMDLLISIDSSPVHMAGALGVKTYMILPYTNEWRWFVDDEKSIWYDSVSIFRQTDEGNWSSAVDKMLDKMDELFTDKANP